MLFLRVVIPQAAAHFAATVACVPTEDACGLFLQCVFGQVHGAQQLPPLGLQTQVFIPQPVNGGTGVCTTPQRTGDDAAHGGF